MPALELDVDLRPGLLSPVAAPDQAVVGEDATSKEDDNYNDNDDDHDHVTRAPFVLTMSWRALTARLGTRREEQARVLA